MGTKLWANSENATSTLIATGRYPRIAVDPARRPNVCFGVAATIA
jgi:hypothetical protein